VSKNFKFKAFTPIKLLVLIEAIAILVGGAACNTKVFSRGAGNGCESTIFGFG
jgi:hypothetical protein